MTNAEILVVKPSSFGDIIHTLPAVSALKSSLPGTAIRWIVNSEWEVLLEGNPHLAGTIPFPRQQFRGLGAFPAFLAWCRSLAWLRPDLVLDFQGLFRSAWIAQSTRAKKIYGLSDAREGARVFYRKTARVGREQHSVQRYLALARLAGARSDVPVEFSLPAGKPLTGFRLPRPLIILHPFSRGPGKSLSLEETSRLINALRPFQPVVVGQSAFKIPELPEPGCLLNRTNLAELIWLLRQADFVISVDSGPAHLAAAVSRKTLSIHFWSDPRKVGPYRPDALIWYNGSTFPFSEVSERVTQSYRGGRPIPEEFAKIVREQLIIG
jgi:heptosyltransferase I